jgi:hypothetical protein
VQKLGQSVQDQLQRRAELGAREVRRRQQRSIHHGARARWEGEQGLLSRLYRPPPAPDSSRAPPLATAAASSPSPRTRTAAATAAASPTGSAGSVRKVRAKLRYVWR